jgi:hypothetical protein
VWAVSAEKVEALCKAQGAGRVEEQDESSINTSKRGRKQYDTWAVFQGRFYLNLWNDDVPAHSRINLHAQAEKLKLWGQNHPEIGEKNTPGDTQMKAKIKEWLLLWPLIRQ